MTIDYKQPSTKKVKATSAHRTRTPSSPPRLRGKFRIIMLGALVGLAAVFTILMLKSTPSHSAGPVSAQLSLPGTSAAPRTKTANLSAQSVTAAPSVSTAASVATATVAEEVTSTASATFLPTLTTFPWQRITVKDGDSLSLIFERLGLSAAQLHRVMNLEHWKHAFHRLLPGEEIDVIIESDTAQLQALRYQPNHTSILLVTHTPEGFRSKLIEKEIETRLAFADVTINHSLFLDGQAAGLSDSLIMQTADIFAWDIDFVLDIRVGDRYRLLYEEHYINGEYVGSGDVLVTEFDTRNQHYQAVRHIDTNGRKRYYTPEGASLRKAFIRTPVDFTRISSQFNPNRKHPILHDTVRPHRGVDYAAPTGTPIRAAGDGKVIKKAYTDGYGHHIILEHGRKYTTLYAHMSRFADGLKKGSTVRQSQTIGYVGASGLATGPHLHYEFRVDGVHHDPLTVALPTAEPIPADQKTTFVATADTLLQQLTQFQNTQLAHAEIEADTIELVGPPPPPASAITTAQASSS